MEPYSSPIAASAVRPLVGGRGQAMGGAELSLTDEERQVLLERRRSSLVGWSLCVALMGGIGFIIGGLAVLAGGAVVEGLVLLPLGMTGFTLAIALLCNIGTF